MKRILQISKYMYPYIGGTEQVARDFAKALSEHPEEVEQKIICFNEGKEDLTDTVDGVEVIRCGSLIKVASQSLSISYPFKLRKVIKDFKPDIIVLHYPNPFVTEFLLPLLPKNTKLVVYWHLDITKQKILGKIFHGQNKRLIKRADKIIGATPKHVDASAYTEFFGDKKYILPYAIDESRLQISEDEIKRANEIRNAHKGEVLGFFIGRHVPYKGLGCLIEASSLIDGNLHFFIAGQGELTEELKEKASGDSKIEFVGRVSDEEWRSYLYACDIFCFPSITRNEAFGLALAEGMYYEKPAVTFYIEGSGVNFVNIDGETGIECPNQDCKAYADALIKLADDEELRHKLGKNARQRVLDNFTVEQFNKNVWKLVESL